MRKLMRKLIRKLIRKLVLPYYYSSTTAVYGCTY